jgi:hypothetical protein
MRGSPRGASSSGSRDWPSTKAAAVRSIDDGAVVLSLGHNPGASSIDLMICLDDSDTTRLQLRRVLLANFGWLTTAGASFALDQAVSELEESNPGTARLAQHMALARHAWRGRESEGRLAVPDRPH